MYLAPHRAFQDGIHSVASLLRTQKLEQGFRQTAVNFCEPPKVAKAGGGVRRLLPRETLPGVTFDTAAPEWYSGNDMNQPQQPKIELVNGPDYRETYANSVQVRVNLWDFFVLFGLVIQSTPEAVSIRNFQGVYLSPQQAKALLNVLQQNVHQYETTFGEIHLEPQRQGGDVLQ